MMDAKERAWDLSNVCIGAISPGARQTTHQSDTTGRWLAAQEVFNIIQQKKLWTSYGAAVGGLRFMLDGKIYSGFKVTYADGWVETWAVTLNHQFSGMKLLDQPLPDSLKPTRAPGCIS